MKLSPVVQSIWSSTLPPLMSDDYIKALITNQDLVEALEYLELKDVSDSLDLSPLRNFKNLQALDLSGCNNLQNMNLKGCNNSEVFSTP